MKTVYWDANVFHALFNEEPNRIEACSRIETAARNNEVQIYTSAISFVECVRLKGRARLDPANKEKIAKYFDHRFIRIVACDRLIGESARELLWHYEHLEYMDAIHVATAIFARVDILHTYDNDDLVRISEQVGAPPLKISNPAWEETPPLPLE
jgi:hypothetical protein